MTSAEIRQSFLDFFAKKQHAIVPSESLLPSAPNLLFTNAGMNQFVPYFLGRQSPPWNPARAADTQKCIRAGGKHNDLEDVGLDTYHHTFFEMLGNWSFGDYFKKEAIRWAWELVVGEWKFPPARLYATVYRPGQGDPGEFDKEAWEVWAECFREAGLDPDLHIVDGGHKDNFWMMGDTGPCGPCSELHLDLTPQGDSQGRLVNADDPLCMEIWNLVFIQYNAEGDKCFSDLPARHVDTGMGLERVAAAIQGTGNFSDFSKPVSNYDTDLFQPVITELEAMSGKSYRGTVPAGGLERISDQEKYDVAFRVIADHIRTLSCAIADGILPGNNDRNYVLRRILRRAVRYGRTLGLETLFFHKLVGKVEAILGGVFPELRERRSTVEQVILQEEESFNKTLDRGIALFEEELGSTRVPRVHSGVPPESSPSPKSPSKESSAPPPAGAKYSRRNLPHFERPWAKYMVTFSTVNVDGRPRILSESARDAVLDALRFFHGDRYLLYAACVMPDHVHLLLEPQVEKKDADGNPVFWSLSKILHSLKSFSAKEVNRLEKTTGSVWEKESFDRLIRSENDLREKFEYICHNPWENGVAAEGERYRWLWIGDGAAREGDPGEGKGEDAGEGEDPARDARDDTRDAFATLSGDFAFKLYDTYGFPLDLTELMARERGMTVDHERFEVLMQEQRHRSQAARKQEVIEVEEIGGQIETVFTGYEQFEDQGRVVDVLQRKKDLFLIPDRTPFYAEMGGQIGDTGWIEDGPDKLEVLDTVKADRAVLMKIKPVDDPGRFVDREVRLRVDPDRRQAIQVHHTATHLLHWALHEVVGPEATQKGSYVGPDRLRFDFNSGALQRGQIKEIERLVNQRIRENAAVSWTEIPFDEAQARRDITQIFGEKYGDHVRVVQIGGQREGLDGYSMELCGGTHVRATGDLGCFRISSEGAIAAGIRRIEAVAGEAAWQQIDGLLQQREARIGELEEQLHGLQKELAKEKAAAMDREADTIAAKLLATEIRGEGDAKHLAARIEGENADLLPAVLNRLKARGFEGVTALFLPTGGRVQVAVQSTDQRHPAHEILKSIAPKIEGRGGGKPNLARGAGQRVEGIDDAITAFHELF